MSSTPARPGRAITVRAGVREEEGGTLVLEKAEPVLRFKRDFEAGHPERIQPRCNHGLLLPGLSGNPLSAVRGMTACVAPGSALSGVSRRQNRRRHQTGDSSRGGRSEERRVGKECRSRWSPYY